VRSNAPAGSVGKRAMRSAPKAISGRARRAEAIKTLRQYSGRRRPPEEALASIADAHLEELLKRGKVTL